MLCHALIALSALYYRVEPFNKDTFESGPAILSFVERLSSFRGDYL